MTWSMFAINYLDLNDSLKADQHFRNGYQRYLQPPFLIWREVAEAQRAVTSDRGGVRGATAGDDKENKDTSGHKNNKLEDEETGAVNFLTGAGGFLQSIMFGYAGLRVLSDRLLINEPHLMPATNELRINGFKYRGLSIDLIVRRGKVEQNEDRSYSIRFGECHGGARRWSRSILLMVNDTEISVDCRHQRSKWCKFIEISHMKE